eukprot:2991507-Pyramimonas_sp.AAC.1
MGFQALRKPKRNEQPNPQGRRKQAPLGGGSLPREVPLRGPRLRGGPSGGSRAEVAAGLRAAARRQPGGARNLIL